LSAFFIGCSLITAVEIWELIVKLCHESCQTCDCCAKPKDEEDQKKIYEMDDLTRQARQNESPPVSAQTQVTRTLTPIRLMSISDPVDNLPLPEPKKDKIQEHVEEPTRPGSGEPIRKPALLDGPADKPSDTDDQPKKKKVFISE